MSSSSRAAQGFYVDGKLRRVGIVEATTVGEHKSRDGKRATGTREHTSKVVRQLLASPAVVGRRPARFLKTADALLEPQAGDDTLVIPTETFVIEGGKSAVLQKLRRDHGVEVVAEGRHGKVLLRVAGDDPERVETAFALARDTWRSGAVAAAHPNFVRAARRPPLGPASTPANWNLDNDGSVGVVGADVRALRAWSITRGTPEAAIALITEGVDTRHPDLRGAVRQERDFVDGRSYALPDGGDTQGTAAAGIVASQAQRCPGLAPASSLLVARVAKGGTDGYWVADDFDVADAIDWSWGSGAEVMLLGWGGGPRVDIIAHAIERARRRGRRGKGVLVVVPAGDSEGPIQYPATLEGVLAVGASNAWDERKTRASRDGDATWGSCAGPELALVAPGARVPALGNVTVGGYAADAAAQAASGTLIAAAHAAAAAALLLSVAPRLTEAAVRELLTDSADATPGQTGPSSEMGHGRLNAFAALERLRRR
jgi:hypothetical protein